MSLTPQQKRKLEEKEIITQTDEDVELQLAEVLSDLDNIRFNYKYTDSWICLYVTIRELARREAIKVVVENIKTGGVFNKDDKEAPQAKESNIEVLSQRIRELETLNQSLERKLDTYLGMGKPNKVEPVSHEVIERQLLIALNDESKVAIIMDEGDLAILIQGIRLLANEVNWNKKSIVYKHIQDMLASLIQLNNEAFGGYCEK